MKKLISFWLCFALLLTMTISVHAEDTLSLPDESGTMQEREDQEKNDPEPDAQPEDTHEHSWTVTDTATCGNAGTITKTCSCGVTETTESPATGKHTWDAGTVTTEANCQQTGIKTYICTVCGADRTEEIPMEMTHEYGEWVTDSTGHSRTCDDCLLVDYANHSWKEEVVKKVSCKEDGITKKSCTVCGYSVTIAVPKLTIHTYDSACDPECNVCERERDVEHSFGSNWVKSGQGHWYECSRCGEKADFSKHVPGPAATEENDQVCLICSYIVTAKKVHVHSYGSEWTSDEVGHWHACTSCDEEKDYAAHTYTDGCDPDCNTCGFERDDNHTYAQNWKTSNFEHWDICTVCGEEGKHEKHIAGPEATDEAAQLCTVCGFELKAMLDHNHDFGTEYLKDQDSHWQECLCGELSVPESHTWGKGKTNKDDTVTYTCTVCGAEKTENDTSSGFPWVLVILVILALICAGGIVVLVILLKRGGFEESAENEEDEEEVSFEEETDAYSDENAEEKLIDEYFASLDEEYGK